MNRDWPNGRGVFFNASHSLVAWVNGEDHLQLMASEDGSDIKAAYAQLSRVCTICCK